MKQHDDHGHAHAERGGPPVRPQRVLVVEHTERLSPHLVRLHLGGPGFREFLAGAKPENLARTDKYVKLLIARPGSGLRPPYDLDALRAALPREELPVRRTYTVRAIDEVAGTMAVDFVVHGDEGVAGPWAAAARPGDVVALSGPGGKYSPSTDDDVTHVLVADESALPAAAAALEAMPQRALGVALIEVPDAADVLPLEAPGGVEVRWLPRPGGAVPGALLVAGVEALERPAGRVQVFAHGERSAMDRVRATVEERWGLTREDVSLSAYWALGATEDRFQAEKRERR